MYIGLNFLKSEFKLIDRQLCYAAMAEPTSSQESQPGGADRKPTQKADAENRRANSMCKTYS